MTGPSELVWLDFLFAQICSLKHAWIYPVPEAPGLHRGQPPVPEALWEEEGQMDPEQYRRMAQ